MAVEYDHSFAPYVMAAGHPVVRGFGPEPKWAAMMLAGQVRARVGEIGLRLQDRASRAMFASSLLHRVGDMIHSLAPTAEGAIPVSGDAEFAYARFAGTNPVSIARARTIHDLPPKLRLDDGLMAELTAGGPSLRERVERGDIFVLRYDFLRVAGEEDLQHRKFVAPASALFCHAPELDAPFPVVPLAIECPSGPAEGETEVVTPLCGARWRAAKRVVGVADVNAAELCLHLARAHFMTVPFAIALRRKVPRQHPLYQLLFPHLRFDLFVGRMAWLAGMQKTAGVLIRSLGGTARWSQDVARTLYYSQSFREQHFERDLEARGLADTPFDYPYRDDGRLLWAAIRRFVAGYVDLTWPNDAAVVADSALQEFVADVTAPAGGNVRGMLAGATLDSKEELIEILTQIIFVAGPLHAIVHYSSAAQLQYANENPSWLTTNPLSAPGTGEPGAVGAIDQYRRVVASNVVYGSLGDFSGYPLGRREDCADLIRSFQAELVGVEAQINARNARRFLPYVHLLPSRIPNGITV